MKIVETKIYLKFIVWFIGVALLPVVALLLTFYIVGKSNPIFRLASLPGLIWVGIFVALALVLCLSLLATRYLSKVVTSPIQNSVSELSKVVNLLLKSIQGLSDISQTNNQISQFLLISSQEQQTGLKVGSQTLSGMVSSLEQIAQKTKAVASDASKTDNLAKEGSDKSQKALASLAAVKNLLTENQKLSQALDEYAHKVSDIAQRVGVVADTAKFFSLNMSIEANKSAFSEEFVGLVVQIRDLNVASEQAASSIQALAQDMHRQIEQSKQSAVFEWRETNKSIEVVSQTLNFFGKIISNVGNISSSVQVINTETESTHKEAGEISGVIMNISKQSKLLVKQADDINKVIQNQLAVTKSLNRSSLALNKVTDSLNQLVGRN